MCGIFGYMNHQVPKTRKEIIQILVDGLKRLEYRGYDSAGIAVDTDIAFEGTESKRFTVIKRSGKVSALQEASMTQVRASFLRFESLYWLQPSRPRISTTSSRLTTILASRTLDGQRMAHLAR